MAQKYRENYLAIKDKKPNILLLSNQLDSYDAYETYVKNSFEDISKKLSLQYNVVALDDNVLDFINDIHDSHRIIYDKALSYYFLEESKQFGRVSHVMNKMIERGGKYTDSDYVDQVNKQNRFTIKMNEIMQKHDIDFIITPSTASVAPKIGNQEAPDSALIWTYFGMPAVSIPVFYNNSLGLPYGLQVVAPRYHDLSLLEFSEVLNVNFGNFNK